MRHFQVQVGRILPFQKYFWHTCFEKYGHVLHKQYFNPRCHDLFEVQLLNTKQSCQLGASVVSLTQLTIPNKDKLQICFIDTMHDM